MEKIGWWIQKNEVAGGEVLGPAEVLHIEVELGLGLHVELNQGWGLFSQPLFVTLFYTLWYQPPDGKTGPNYNSMSHQTRVGGRKSGLTLRLERKKRQQKHLMYQGHKEYRMV